MPRRTDHLDAMRREMGELPAAPMPVPPSVPAPVRRGIPAAGRHRRGGEETVGGFGGFVVSVAVFLLIVFAWPDSDTVRAWSDKVVDNAPIGTCIGTRQAWTENNSTITPVPCDQPHWGEILGYPLLAATPSPYPGDAQAQALASFRCGLLFAERGPASDRYAYRSVYRTRASWNEASSQSENYATCVVHARDDSPLPAQVVHAGQPTRSDASVPMSLFAARIEDNAPTGVCVETKASVDTAAGNVPMVPCEQRHWAEILSYPTLYPSTSTWPGDAAVYAAADAACRRAVTDRRLPAQYTHRVIWPAQSWWSQPKGDFYTTCLAFRTDNQQFAGPLR